MTLRTLGWRVVELPRESTRTRLLRWDLKPPPTEGTEKPRRDAADAASEDVPASQNTTDGAANMRQNRGDAAPTANGVTTPQLMPHPLHPI
jgi:hypothetical protein